MTRALLSRLLSTASLTLLPLMAGAVGSCASNPPLPAPTSEAVDPEADERLMEVAREEEARRIDRMATREATIHQEPESTPKLTAAPDVPAELKLEKKTRELYVAQLEAHLAEEKALHAEAKAADELRAAERALTLAKAAVQHYTKKEAPRLMAEQTLKLDRSKFSVERMQQNLEQMREEYSKYEVDGAAKSTGKIVIWRAETELELAQRSEQGAQDVLVKLTGNTLPLQLEKLGTAVVTAEQGLRKANEAIVRLAVENKLSLTRARNKQTFLELELEQLRAKQPVE